MDEPMLYTVGEVAAALRVTPQTVRNWIDQGVVSAIRVGRAFRVRQEVLDELLRGVALDETQRPAGGVWEQDANDPPLIEKPNSGTGPSAASEEPGSVWGGAGLAALIERGSAP